MSAHLLNCLIVFALGATKFQLASIYARASGLSFFEALLLNIAGGISGLFVFLYLLKYLINLFLWIKRRLTLNLTFLKTPPPKKIFSNRRRFFVKFIRKYGLAGIAIITPSVLSIPLGVILAERLNSRLVKDRSRLVAYMTFSIVFWSLFFSTLVYV
jgi:hypothetical protein